MDEKNTSKKSGTKKLLQYSSFVLVFLAVIFSATAFMITFYDAVYGTPQPQFPIVSASSEQAAGSDIIPDILSIPSLDINAHIEHVGITAKGDVGIPSSFTTTAWYEYGPKPGDPGMAIIDGHVNNGLGLPGVFLNLNTIKIGADVDIADTSGKTLHYVVVSTSTLAYTDHLNDVIAGQSNTKSQLVLLTCEGTWVPSDRTYNKRIVVLADLK